jgi:hypothetical protein
MKLDKLVLHNINFTAKPPNTGSIKLNSPRFHHFFYTKLIRILSPRPKNAANAAMKNDEGLGCG